MPAPDYFDHYTWQADIPGFSPQTQQKLRDTTALISRVGGLGGPLAFSLAAAGVGKIILAHSGPLRPDDLNRQILMTGEALGGPRHEQAAATLRRFNPAIEVESVDQNITPDNAAALVARADIVFSCAPLFEERLLMNREAVAQKKLFVDGAMHSLEGHVLPVRPGESACLGCLIEKPPEWWTRRFPVIGAVSALVAQIAALEGIKLLTNFSPPHAGTLIHIDAATMRMNKLNLRRNPDCTHCSSK
ncbi:MAG: HesA/MoeB/ThiF family protein [Verrucomicrobiales bacterium]|nr:HesA/MoeB/ThiF family protein [Verrucomicrobiales bacterium]